MSWFASPPPVAAVYKGPATLISIAAIAVVGLAVCAPMFWYGAPNGADILTSRLWMHHFSSQLAQGDLYPRWLMDMNRGAGSPAFYFYGPLPFYILSLPALVLQKFKLSTQLAWGDFLLLTMSGISFYLTSRKYCANVAAVSASVLYMLLPYHFEVDLWGRQDLGELANYIWMPLAFLYINELLAGRDGILGLAVCYGLMFSSHLPSTLLFSICLGGYLLAFIRNREWMTHLLRISAAICLGLLLTGLYWVPAMFSQKYIHAEAWWIPRYDFHLWLFPVRDLEAFHGDEMSRAFDIRVFTVIGATSATLLWCWLSIVMRNGVGGLERVGGYLSMVGVALFLMTSASTLIWENLPLLRDVQFPSRLAMVVDVVTATVFAHAISDWKKSLWHSASAMLVSVLILGSCLLTAKLKQTLEPFADRNWLDMRDTFTRDNVDTPEYATHWSSYDPNTFDHSLNLAGRRPLVFDPTRGSITVSRWLPRDIKLNVDLQKPADLSVRQYYFPNWIASTDARTRFPVTPDRRFGLLLLSLPKGKYGIELRLEPLPQEVVGATLTSVGVLVFVAFAVWQAKRKRPVNLTHTHNFTLPR